MTNQSHHDQVVPQTRLSAAEIAALEALEQICNVHEGLHIKLNWEMIRRRSGAEPSDFCVFHEGTLIGYAPLDGFGNQYEVTVLVHPAYRRRGIGRALLAAAETEAGRRGGRLLLVCERASSSGQAFVAASGAALLFSEYHMLWTQGSSLPEDSGQVHLRLATPDDTELLVRLQIESFGDPAQARSFVERELASPSNRTFIATVGDEPVGRIGVFEGHGESYLRAFGVLEAYRRRGYGRQILGAAVRMLLAEQRAPITLDVETDNERALTLYYACGFQAQTIYDYFVPRSWVEGGDRHDG
jgi:ribosomal protein S18 acetylase RimI-like enzyme